VDVLLAEVEDKKRVPPLELTPASRRNRETTP